MKQFYEVANRYMRIKRSNPVVTKIKRSRGGVEEEIFEERIHVEKAISDYFSDIYRRLEHMVANNCSGNEDEKMIDTVFMFTFWMMSSLPPSAPTSISDNAPTASKETC